MHLDFDLPTWGFALLLTAAIWIAGNWRFSRKTDTIGFGIGHIVDAYVYSGLCLFGTLVTWMGYFAILAWSRS